MTEDNNDKKGRKTINLRETEFLRKLASSKSDTTNKSVASTTNVDATGLFDNRASMKRFIDAFNAEMLVQSSEMIIPMHVWLGCTPAEFVVWKKTKKWPARV